MLQRKNVLRGAAAVCAVTAGLVGSAGLASASGPTTQLTIEGNTNTVLNLNPFNGVLGINLLYNSLELVNPSNGTPAPELATAYQAVNSKTLVYTIRQGVKWSNKTPFTPADVVFTFNLIKKFPALGGGGVWSQLSSVSASGDKVIFHLKTPDVPLNLTIAEIPIVSQKVWRSVRNPVTFENQHPVVTGPYTLGTYAPTELVLKKNPLSFEAGHVVPKTVAFIAGSSNQATNELLVASGTYDFSYNYFPDVKATYVSRDPAHNKYWFPAGGVVCLYMNLTTAPFSNRNFRQGVSYAINRRSVENKAVFGLEGVAPQTGLMLPAQRAWQDPNIPNNGLITQNTSKALAAFAKAGFTVKNGQMVNSSGKQVSFQIMVPTGWTDWDSAAQQIATSLNALGMNVTLDEISSNVYFSSTQAGQFQAALGSFGGSGNSYSAYYPALDSSFVAPINTASVNNFERFSSAWADKALTTLAGAVTPAAQLHATWALENVMYNDVPFIDLYYGGMWGLFSTRHWTGWPSAKNPYTTPATWNDDLLAILLHVKAAK